MERGGSSPSECHTGARGEGRWRSRVVAYSIFAALAAGLLAFGPSALSYLLVETGHDSYVIPGVGEVRRIMRVHRLDGRAHGIQEEWYGSGSQKSWVRFDRGKLLELIHWSPEGLLDGWWLPRGGVEVIWVQGEGGEAWKEQARTRPSGPGEAHLVVEFRVDAMEHARENTPGTREGFFTPEEIIELVRAVHASAPGPRVEIVEPPIQAPRRVGGIGPEER